MGVSWKAFPHEASSLAGHLCLDNLILIHDANKVTLDGFLAESCSEDTKMRYQAYGWDVFDLDGYDLDAMEKLFLHLRDHQTKPCYVMMTTIIGKGSPNKAGTHKVHGSPLGVEEVEATKKALGLPEEEFYVPQTVYNFFEQKLGKDAGLEQKWKEMFRAWSEAKPDLYKVFMQMVEKRLPDDLEAQLAKVEIKSPLATSERFQRGLECISRHAPAIDRGIGRPFRFRYDDDEKISHHHQGKFHGTQHQIRRTRIWNGYLCYRTF